MFTGIVEQMGTVDRLIRRGGGARLEVRSSDVTSSLRIGDSIAVNGSCVTVTETNGEVFACDLVPETVARTNLGILQVGEHVNLEMPMRIGDRIGGHLVQGHVDCVGTVRSRRRAGAQEMLEVNIPFELTKYIATQGSVAIDGVSLTVVGVDKDRFRVALIPHTVSVTTLGQKGQGSSVNVEVDVLAKYVERQIDARQNRPRFVIHDPAEERPAPPSGAAPVPAATGASSSRPKASSKPARAPAARTPAKKAAKGARKKSARQTATKKAVTAGRTTAKRSGAARAAAKKKKSVKRPAAKRRR